MHKNKEEYPRLFMIHGERISDSEVKEDHFFNIGFRTQCIYGGGAIYGQAK